MGLGNRLEGKGAGCASAQEGIVLAAPEAGSHGGEGDRTGDDRAGSPDILAARVEGLAAGEPCTLEEFARMMAARGAWAEQGLDVSAMLERQFGLTALEWSNLGAYWNVKIGCNYRLGVELGKLMESYKARYSGGGRPPA